MNRARAGDHDTAARAELALLGIAHPTPPQVAGALLRAHHAADVRFIASAFEEA